LSLATNQDWPLLQFNLKNVSYMKNFRRNLYGFSTKYVKLKWNKGLQIKKVIYGLKQSHKHGLEGSLNL